MTPAELKEARRVLGMSTEGFARLVRVQSGRTVRRWERGDAPIPGAVDVILEQHASLGGVAMLRSALEHASLVLHSLTSWEVRIGFDCGAALNDFLTALREIRNYEHARND